ncbi:type II toxin-antitoxin system HipA family toxin YjjJ [Amphibiibacter pelophylacis]|uniref:Type II toxin-antitoxin system HipA family toxin YjjJ n=1 Tax=Amphibiibacter pelophylacis TaxID=1799477 RepID=A0ACC6P3U3_9BURK
MLSHPDRIRQVLSSGPAGPRQLIEKIGFSQPTLSRTLAGMSDEVVRMGAARSIQYALRDPARGLGDIPVHRVAPDGTVRPAGLLIAVRPEGFVLLQADGSATHSDSLSWWLLDMRPQGFLGRAYVAQHATQLGLPQKLSEWRDTDILRALTAQGHDAIGHLLLGDLARARFLEGALPQAVSGIDRGPTYARLAQAAVLGDLPGSSAGGEQPKFTTFAETAQGPRHVLVKFSLPDARGDNPVTRRWRDLLLAEHHALRTLSDAGVPAARSQVLEHAGQRFLELERFDRVGALGRRGLYSLAAIEAQWLGDASAPWPRLVARLADLGLTDRASAQKAALLYAFGTLTGNTDMHNGNLSLTSDSGLPPFTLAPAYDMLPMGFAPRSGGALPDQLPAPALHASVDNATWRQAQGLAAQFLENLGGEPRLSAEFSGCLEGLARHLETAQARIGRLG